MDRAGGRPIDRHLRTNPIGRPRSSVIFFSPVSRVAFPFLFSSRSISTHHSANNRFNRSQTVSRAMPAAMVQVRQYLGRSLAFSLCKTWNALVLTCFFCLLLHVQFALVDQQEESGQPFREPPRESPKGENEIGHSVMSCVTLDSTYHLFYLQKHREKRKHSDPNLPPSHSRLVNHLVVAKWGVLYAYVLLFFAKYDVHKVTLKSWSISSMLISYF